MNSRPHNPHLRHDKRTLCWYRRNRLIDAPPTNYPPISDIWEATIPIENTPAEIYLQGRLKQQPKGDISSLRWLPADNKLNWRNGTFFTPFRDAAGWLAAPYYHITPLGELIGDPIQIQLLQLRPDGKRLKHSRKAKTYGRSNGTNTACLALRRDRCIECIHKYKDHRCRCGPRPVIIAESVITALAADIIEGSKAQKVVSTGGTSQAVAITQSLSWYHHTRYHADGDEAGNKVADQLTTTVVRYTDGTDAADHLTQGRT